MKIAFEKVLIVNEQFELRGIGLTVN